MGARAKVTVRPDVTTKTYVTPELAKAETNWYRLVSWAAPKLIDFHGSTLVIETCKPATELPDWRPVAALRDLLTMLHDEGLHHRDLHLKNVVRGRDGRPLLIDWETAIEYPAEFSYDLHGPAASGVPIPEIHTRLIPAWWGSREKMSIKNQWGIE
jgi:hypothetical protein